MDRGKGKHSKLIGTLMNNPAKLARLTTWPQVWPFLKIQTSKLGYHVSFLRKKGKETQGTQFVSFDQSGGTGDINVKACGSILGELSFKMLWWTSLQYWIRVLTLSLMLKLPSRKLA